MKAIMTMILACTFGILTAQEVDSSQATLKRAEDAISLELSGLVLDQTRTRIGREFYEQFFGKWTAEAFPNEHDILIEELPSRGRLGFLRIKVEDSIVAAYHLQPGGEWMEAAVFEAVKRLENYFLQLAEVQNNLEDIDLIGSGIY